MPEILYRIIRMNGDVHMIIYEIVTIKEGLYLDLKENEKKFSTQLVCIGINEEDSKKLIFWFPEGVEQMKKNYHHETVMACNSESWYTFNEQIAVELLDNLLKIEKQYETYRFKEG